MPGLVKPQLALIHPVDLGRWLYVPVVPCESCGQDMPADHDLYPNTKAAPVAPETASDPTKEINS